MPTSFKVEHDGDKEYIESDFGESAIARVPPVDSCLWWLLLLRAYIKTTEDIELSRQPDFQAGIKLILDLCLAHWFSMYPTLPVLDGSFTIDRRMGVYGHPLEIQVLFYAALRTAKEYLLPDNDGDRYYSIGFLSQRLGTVFGVIALLATA